MMKRYSMIAASLAVALAASAFATSSAAAQDDASRDRTRAGQLDDKTAGTAVRVSQLMGMNIQNRRGNRVGEVQDIVIDARSGRVRYAAVTYGGFLGLGNKLFAVPFEAFECRQDPNDKDEHVLVLDVTQKQLEGARGFDQDRWPDFADRNFTSQLDKRYGVERKSRNRKRDN